MPIKVEIKGNIGDNPSIKPVVIPNKDTKLVLNFSIATQEYKAVTDHTGRTTYENVGEPQWFRISYWRNDAEAISRLIRKGMQLHIVGELTFDKYKDQDGHDRESKNIKADSISLGFQRLENIHVAPAKTRNPASPDDQNSVTNQEDYQ